MIQPPGLQSFFLLATLLTNCLAVAASERAGQGPLYVRAQNPGQSFRLTSLPHDARGLPSDTRALGIQNTLSNVWGESERNDYLLDFQMNDLGLFFASSSGSRATVGLGLTERRIINAHTDQIVLQVHEALGLGISGRDRVPRNDLNIDLGPYDYELGYEELNNRLISRSAEGFLIWNWINGGNSGLSLASFTHLRHELSNEALVTENSTDVALGLALTQPIGSEVLYANLSWTRLGKTEKATIPIKKNLYSGMLSWEHRFSPATSFYVQYLVDSQIFAHNLGELSEPAHELQFGLKWRQKRLTWQLVLVENLFVFNNSPDFSLSLGLHYNFRTAD